MRVFSAEIVHDIYYLDAELSDTFVSSLERAKQIFIPTLFFSTLYSLINFKTLQKAMLSL